MKVKKSTEILPGLFRLGGKLGDRFFYQYLFVEERTLLVDTGVPPTPEDVILPAFREIGLKPSGLDFVLNTHADVDHFGGNRVIKNHASKAVFFAHELDAPLIENKEKILAERYGWYSEFGIGYTRETWAWLSESAGVPVRLDVHLAGEMSLRIGNGRTLKLLHLPGHSAGHMGVYDENEDALVLGDAVLGNGLFNTKMELIAPPPYIDVRSYIGSIRKIQSLKPQHLLAAHYPQFRGADVIKFLNESMSFVKELRRSILEVLKDNRAGLELKELLAETSSHVGSFKSFSNELAASIRAHLLELEQQKRVGHRGREGKTIWYVIR